MPKCSLSLKSGESNCTMHDSKCLPHCVGTESCSILLSGTYMWRRNMKKGGAGPSGSERSDGGSQEQAVSENPSLPSPGHPLPANHRESDRDFPAAPAPAASAGCTLTSSELVGGGKERRTKEACWKPPAPGWGQESPGGRSPPLLANQWLIFLCFNPTEQACI